jgi:hypothetical protein
MSDRPRDPNYVGAAVVNGKIRFFSVSSLKKGDPSTTEGCPRAWAFRYVHKKKEPENENQAYGKQKHSEVAHYLTTGEKTRISAVVARGLHLLPKPGPDLIVEQEISGTPKLSAPRLFANGIPLIGQIDLCHRRGVNVGGSDVEDTIEPANTAEVADHKFVGSFDRNLAPIQIPRDIQMAGYGQLACNVFPDIEHVRLSLHYFHKTKNTPAVKSSIRLDRRAIEVGWESVNSLARLLVDVAAFSGDPNLVEANTRACSAYSGCAHASYCTAYRDNSLSQVFGAMGASILPAKHQGTSTMDMLSQLGQPAGVPAQLTDPNALAAQYAAQLAAAQQAQQPPQPVYQLPQGFAEAAAMLDRAGRGWPALVGEAAIANAAMRNIIVPPGGTAFAASGQFAQIPPENAKPVATVADFIKLAQEITAFVARQAQQAQPPAQQTTVQPAPVAAPAPQPTYTPMPLVPPETPASNPALAANPMPNMPAMPQAPAQVAAPMQAFLAQQAQPPAQVPAPQPVAAPAQLPQPVAQVAAPATPGTVYTAPPAQPDAGAGKGKGGRRKKAAAATGTPSLVPGAANDPNDAFAELVAAKVIARLADLFNSAVEGE